MRTIQVWRTIRMRTVLILFPLVPICSLGADLVIRILFPPAGLLLSEQTLYGIGELLLEMACMILFFVFYWQQGPAIDLQINRQGSPPTLPSALFPSPTPHAHHPHLPHV